MTESLRETERAATPAPGSAPVAPAAPMAAAARFAVGQLVRHRLYDYRGVVFDIDPVFSGESEWYETVARSRPSKDQPWHHVLVDDASHATYVAESNLEATDEAAPIRHPAIDEHFHDFVDGGYRPRATYN